MECGTRSAELAEGTSCLLMFSEQSRHALHPGGTSASASAAGGGGKVSVPGGYGWNRDTEDGTDPSQAMYKAWGSGMTTKRYTGALAVAILVIGGMMSDTIAGDWPQWRGPNRDGVSDEVVTIAAWPPALVWSNTVALGESAVAVSGCFAYTMGREGENNLIYCFDSATGSNVWTYSYTAGAASGRYGPQATPTVSGGELYTFDDAGLLLCLNRTTGSALWSTNLNLSRGHRRHSRCSRPGRPAQSGGRVHRRGPDRLPARDDRQG